MMRVFKASVLAFVIARTRRLIDIKSEKPKRAPTTDIPPPEYFDYVEVPMNTVVNIHEPMVLHPDNNYVTGPKSLTENLGKGLQNGE